MSERRHDSLLPDGCTCGHYGHGLTMTRVHMASCDVHGDGAIACIKHGPMANLSQGQRWCKCASPVIQNCERDQ